MKLVLKSNGKEIEMSSEAFNKFTNDQKRAYHVIDKSDDQKEKVQVVKKDPPPNGDSAPVVKDKKK